MMPGMTDGTEEFSPEERAEAAAQIRWTLAEMAADPNGLPTDSPLDVPPEVLADAKAQAQVIADQIRQERAGQAASPLDVDLADLVEAERIAREVMDRRRLTSNEAEAIDGPPYDAEG